MEIEIQEIVVDNEIEINDVELSVEKVYPQLINLKIRPTNKKQEFIHEGSYGYDKISVEPMDIKLQDKEIKENGEYVADEGYDAIHKINVATCKIMSLPENDSIDNYDIIEEPKEEIIEEPQDNEKIKRLLDAGFSLEEIEEMLKK